MTVTQEQFLAWLDTVETGETPLARALAKMNLLEAYRSNVIPAEELVRTPVSPVRLVMDEPSGWPERKS